MHGITTEPGLGDSGRLETVRVGGVPVSTLSLRALIERMLRDAPRRVAAGEPALLVFDCNGHGLSLNATDPAFARDLAQGDLIHADGQVIVKASHWVGGPAIADRSSTTDMFIDSLPGAAAAKVRYYLLGGTEQVNKDCAERIISTTPGLELAGRRNGFWKADEEQAVIDAINAAAPDVLWVGTGKPREQAFCVRHRDRIKAGWIVTCGGLFNYITGDYPRAPMWMQNAGLEWLHRMATNPRHLAWRYLTTNPHALYLIWKHRNG
ncbi:WecB/TagA/CpsF family glycosyltransferase [Sphingomonas psychrotolerans]|uniref:Glycosyltransferase n=1 Tax=Sphingomonas psychrotolerans TaxID=1327635 RepID=A0A2K8M9T2_9SPHN|nr:WecB/TagA/CpsF family glycosyltransferase [Sphingomonas psychrotolerans]ATY30627.1 glycosyltransferase [Sphingomonas psychrotolerans]